MAMTITVGLLMVLMVLLVIQTVAAPPVVHEWYLQWQWRCEAMGHQCHLQPVLAISTT